jgi:hypothetical protein
VACHLRAGAATGVVARNDPTLTASHRASIMSDSHSLFCLPTEIKMGDPKGKGAVLSLTDMKHSSAKDANATAGLRITGWLQRARLLLDSPSDWLVLCWDSLLRSTLRSPRVLVGSFYYPQSARFCRLAASICWSFLGCPPIHPAFGQVGSLI